MSKYKILEIEYEYGYFTVSNLDKLLLDKCKLFWGIVLKTDILKRGGNRRGVKACCVFLILDSKVIKY